MLSRIDHRSQLPSRISHTHTKSLHYNHHTYTLHRPQSVNQMPGQVIVQAGPSGMPQQMMQQQQYSQPQMYAQPVSAACLLFASARLCRGLSCSSAVAAVAECVLLSRRLLLSHVMVLPTSFKRQRVLILAYLYSGYASRLHGAAPAD